MAKGSTTVDAALKAQAEANEALEAARATARTELEGRLAELATEAEGLRTQLRELGGKGGRKRSVKRASNEQSLIVAVASVLGKKPMALSDICEAVTKSGYKTNSDNFKTMVSQSLGKLVDMKVGASNIVTRTGEHRSYEFAAGSGMARFLANPESAVSA